jgi:hypothetical protein
MTERLGVAIVGGNAGRRSRPRSASPSSSAPAHRGGGRVACSSPAAVSALRRIGSDAGCWEGRPTIPAMRVETLAGATFA